MTSLYERLGGEAAINAVVDGMYVKIFNDPELSDFFKKTDKARQKQMQAKFLTMATGGPNAYEGKNMHEAHKGRGIHNKEFDIVCSHVIKTMKELGVTDDLINETASLLLPLRPDCTEPEDQ
jgi:hemoglobin